MGEKKRNHELIVGRLRTLKREAGKSSFTFSLTIQITGADIANALRTRKGTFIEPTELKTLDKQSHIPDMLLKETISLNKF